MYYQFFILKKFEYIKIKITIMKGRIFKFRLDDETINHDMDNFLFNIVKNRQRNQIYLTKGRVALNTLEENDYIFIQSKSKITHYMRCNSQGPKQYD